MPTRQPTRELFTIGHSTHDESRFLKLLGDGGIEVLADVRAHPRSRRPHFNQAALAASLEGAGIEYRHLGAELGGRRSPRGDSPNVGLGAKAFRGYADHMESEDFAAGIAELERLASTRRVAVMCAEGDWRRCHRRLVADALVVREWQVTHLLPNGSTESHELTPSAVVDGWRITYPEQQTSLGV